MTTNLDEFEIIFLIGLDFQSSTRTRKLTYDFPKISRTSRVLLIPINKPLNIEEREIDTKSKFSKILLEGLKS
jgi:hypothetical protein